MELNTKSFTRLVQDQAAAMQTAARSLLDFTTGSVLRAITEANAAVALWLQGLILNVLTMTRLATSVGADADAWVNDWGVTRLGAALAAGQVTFSRFTPTADVVIPVGALVQTADGLQNFIVVADATNDSWSLASNGYRLPSGVASVTVPVQSAVGSANANVVAGSISVLLTNIVGVDYVNNDLPVTGGADAESDDDLRARFVLFIASLSKATVPAIKYAVASVRLGLQATVLENVNADGSDNPGYITVTVDDGTGSPSADLLATVSAKVNQTRAAGVDYGVFPPVIQSAAVVVALTTAVGYDHDVVVGLVADAVTSYINSLPLGESLYYLKLAQVIYDTSPGIIAIPTLSIDSFAGDLVATPRNVIKTSILTVV